MEKKTKKFRWDAVAERVDNGMNILGAELGVWKGKMSEKLLGRLPNLKLIMVDRWTPPVPGDSYHTSGSQMALCNKEDFERVYDEALSRIEPYADKCIIYRMTTVEASKKIEDNSLDFVFIDADHSYEGVKNDIIHWRKKVKPGGWLCGHDWGKLNKGNVEKAVREFFKPEEIELDANSTWFVRI